MAEESDEGRPGTDKATMEINKKRRLKTPAQLMALENFYNGNKYPKEEMKARLAEEVGLTEKQVSGWFCHRRLKDKRSSKEEAYGTVRQERSIVIVQDHGSGLRQDSCGSTKQMDHKSNEPREVDSQRMYGHASSAPGLPHGQRSYYAPNSDEIESTSSESRLSLQDRVVSREDAENSRYSMKNVAAMQPIPRIPRNAVYKPSGYLKVKGEIENAAVTAVKRQLGRLYCEDGPPLSVEFDPIPPGAFESLTNDTFNEATYVGAHQRPSSPNASVFGKHLDPATRYKICLLKRQSPDLCIQGANDKIFHETILEDPTTHWQLQKQTPLSETYPFSELKYPLDEYEGHPPSSSLFNGRRGKINSRHSAEGKRRGAVQNHHGIYGDLTAKLDRPSLYEYDSMASASSKFAKEHKSFSSPSNLVHELEGSLDFDKGEEYSERVEKFYGERMQFDGQGDTLRVKAHLTDSLLAGNHARAGYYPEAGAKKALYNVMLLQKSPKKRPAFQVPCSFSEDETAEISSSVD